MIRLQGTSQFRQSPRDVAVAKMLLQFKQSGLGEGAAARFFSELAGRGGSMRDVIRVKTNLADAGLLPDFLGDHFPEGGSQVEQSLLIYRRKVTADGINYVLNEFKGRTGKNAVFLAEVGSWRTQVDRALTFVGDIDFSFVSNDTALTTAMKRAFDAYIERVTGLDSVRFDSVCTAHGKATLDVYIGEHGRMYAEEQMHKGTLKPIDLSSGTLGDALPGGRVIEQMALEAGAAKAGGSVEGAKHSTEPGLSLENIRHLNHDIISPQIFDPVDSVIKASKYLERSNAAAGTGADRTGQFAGAVKAAQGASDWKRVAQLFKGYFGDAFTFEQVAEGGRMTAKLKANEETVRAYFETCSRTMWQNAETGFGKKLNDLEERIRELESRKSAEADAAVLAQDAEKVRQEMVKLTDMVESEMTALVKDAHISIPESFSSLHEKFKGMVKDFNARFGLRRLSEEELKQKRFVEELIKSKQKSSLHIAAAYVMNKAMAAVEGANNILDFLDNKLLGELRASNEDFNGFVGQYKEAQAAALKDPKGAVSLLRGLKQRSVSGIQRINQAFNDTIQSSAAGRGGVKLMMVVGLVDEAQAYYEAFNREGWGGLATEFFRRRVPGGSAVEQLVMENYLLAGWEAVKTLVPPIGMIEAAAGIGKYALWDMPVRFYWNEELGALVDSLYAGAKFKLVGVESYEGAKLGVWRLVSVKYRGSIIDLQSFIKYKQAQIEAMQQELKKGLNQRDMSVKAYFGLTDRLGIDQILRNTIEAQDPVLRFIRELMENPNVGPRLAAHLGDVYKTRWEEAKLNFVLSVIKQLEERKAADDALARGQLPEMFAELQKLTTDLQIAEAVEKQMDADLDTNNAKAIVRWLWNMKRDLFSEGQMESDVTKAAQIVRRYLDAYRIVAEARQEAEGLLGYGASVDHGRRLLTGAGFLIGRIEEDKTSAVRWYQFVVSSRGAAEKQLLEIKANCVPQPKLESQFDREAHKQLSYYIVWQGVWSSLFKKDPANSSAFVQYAKEHHEKMAAVLKAYKEQYQKGCAQVSINGPEKVKLGEEIVLTAVVKFPVPRKATPTLLYQWSDVRSGLRFTEHTETYRPKTTAIGPYQVKVEVMEAIEGKWVKAGEAVHAFSVEKTLVSITGPNKAIIGEKMEFSAVTGIPKESAGGLLYAWRWEGTSQSKGNTEKLFDHIDQPGSYTLNLIVYQEVNRQSVKLGEAKHTVVVEQPAVTVAIDGPKRSMIGQDVGYRALLRSAAKGGQFTYAWSLDHTPLKGNSDIQWVKAPGKGSHTVKVEVFMAVGGKWQKMGEATTPLDVQEPFANCYISTPKDRLKIGESTTLTGMISETNMLDTSSLYFVWQVDGHGAGTGASYTYSGGTSGTHTVTVELWMRGQPQPVRFCQTSRAVFVEPKALEKKPDEKKVEEKPPRPFDQLNDKEKENVLTCLCKCNSTANQSIVSVYWDPKPLNASPHCFDAGNGPCVNQGFGCWRHYPEGGSDCAKNCTKRAGVISVPDGELNKGKELQKKK
jgi:hypothetical protein